MASAPPTPCTASSSTAPTAAPTNAVTLTADRGVEPGPRRVPRRRHASTRGQADGTFTRALASTGPTFGTPTSIPLYNSTFLTDLPNITGLAYPNEPDLLHAGGRLEPVHRGCSPTESQVVGARPQHRRTGTVSSLNPARVQGMFISGSTLYFADKTDGHLYSIGLTGAGIGVPGTVTGTATLVNSSIDWRARGDLVWNGSPALTPNQLPTAVATGALLGQRVHLRRLRLGRPRRHHRVVRLELRRRHARAPASTPSHTYAAAGTYIATLTVTDNRGGTASTAIPVDAGTPPNLPPTAAYTSSCTSLNCTFDALRLDRQRRHDRVVRLGLRRRHTATGATTRAHVPGPAAPTPWRSP